jgi:hypothetical protein
MNSLGLRVRVSLACASLFVCGTFACRSEGDSSAVDDPVIAPEDCDSGATCRAAALLGTLSGDTGDGGLRASGTTSTWLHVRVTEDDDDVQGRPVRLRAELAGADGFELRAYLDDSRNADAGLECAKRVGRSTPSASGSRLDLSWGDPPDATANGVDDGRTVALEVVQKDGLCAANRVWRLQLNGNP